MPARRKSMVQPVPEPPQVEAACTDAQLAMIIKQRGYDRNYSVAKRDYSSGQCVWFVWFEGDDHATEIRSDVAL